MTTDKTAQPVLVYFTFRGRAEPIRLMLADLGIDWQEDAIADFKVWRKIKISMPFARVPVYKEGGLEIPESHAIMRHLARVHGCYGKDEIEATHCDVLADAMRDVMDALVNLIWDKDFEDKREAFINKRLERSLARIEHYLTTLTREEDYWVGGAMSFVDYIGWHLLDIVRALSPESLAAQPVLAALHVRFARRPNIAAYLASDRRYPTMTAPIAYFGNTPETS